MSNGDATKRDERWELASRAAHEGIWDWDLRTNKVYRSEYWFEMFGYEPGELADNPWVWENMVHPDDLARVLEQRSNHIAGLSQRYYVEHRMRCKDGQYRWFLSRGQVVRDEQGKPVRMLGFYTNIEARVAEQQQLIRQNKALQILNDVALRSLGAEDYDVILTYLLNRARDYMVADKAYLFLLDVKADVMRVHSLSGYIGPSILVTRRGEFLTGRVWETGAYAYQAEFDKWPGRPPTPDSSQIKTGLGVPLMVEQELVGVMTMGFQTDRIVAEDEKVSLYQFAAIAAQLVYQREKNRSQCWQSRRGGIGGLADRQELRLELIESLIAGKPIHPQELKQHAKKCGLSDYSNFLAMQVETDAAGGFPKQIGYTLNPHEGCLLTQDGKLFVLLFTVNECFDKKQAVAKAAELMQKLIEFVPDASCKIGVGLPFSSLRECHGAFQQAVEALEIGPCLRPGNSVHYYLDVGLIHVLSRQKDRRYVDLYLQHSLGKLVEYDQQKNGHLLETLAAILRENSLRVAAESLYVHTKTLMFRKQKIEEILGESLDDPAIRLNMLLALQLYGVQNDWESKRS